MSGPPIIAPPEAQPGAGAGAPERSEFDQRGTATASAGRTALSPAAATETLARPFRLGVVGLGAMLGLGYRLAVANGFGDIGDRSVVVVAALSSAIVALGMLAMAAERDRFGLPMVWISAVTAFAWGVLNWISPPFADGVTVWSRPDQIVLSLLGVGNGLLLAGLIALAFARRHPTLTVAATLLAGLAALVANTLLLRNEWGAIVSIGAAFALILLAWDRSPRREMRFDPPPDSPRFSRAALSFVSVALCGTAIQLWLSRMSIPRSIPAVGVSLLLVAAAFASLVRVRREIEQRQTTLSEWTSWMREIRNNDFRAEMENFDSGIGDLSREGDVSPPDRDSGSVAQAPRKLNFPGLTVDGPPTSSDLGVVIVPDSSTGPDELTWLSDNGDADDDPFENAPVRPPESLDDAKSSLDAAALDALWSSAFGDGDQSEAEAAFRRGLSDDSDAPEAAPSKTAGAFSAVVAPPSAAPVQPEPAHGVELGDLEAMAGWLTSADGAERSEALVVAVEAMSLDEFETLPPRDAAMATQEIGAYLAEVMPDADLVSWIDGPYFLIAHSSKKNSELLSLNRVLRKALKPTDGMLALLRPGPDPVLDDLVDDAVSGLLQARRAQEKATGR